MDIRFSNYGQERDLKCTDEERSLFDRIIEEYPNEDLRLVRVSDNYVTVKRNDWDIVRMKFTKRAKWLMFPTMELKQEKHYIERVEEIDDYVGIILESIQTAKKWENK